jgi:DNA segregation ATPase FtsK/SpoIIIE, S-DNA-T family
MTTPDTPGRADQGAQVVSLDDARENRNTPALASPDTAQDTPALEGQVVRVDQPGSPPGDWLADLMTRSRERRPVIHPAFRSRRELLATLRWVGSHYLHVSAFHLVRVPLYGAKLTVRSPRGAAKVAGGLTRWALDLEGHPVRMAAVAKADPEVYLKLSRQRDARVRLRVIVTGAVVVIS